MYTMCACYSTHMDVRGEVSGVGSQFSSGEFCGSNMSSDSGLRTFTENHLTSNKPKHLLYPLSKINKSITKIARYSHSCALLFRLHWILPYTPCLLSNSQRVHHCVDGLQCLLLLWSAVVSNSRVHSKVLLYPLPIFQSPRHKISSSVTSPA